MYLFGSRSVKGPRPLICTDIVTHSYRVINLVSSDGKLEKGVSVNELCGPKVSSEKKVAFDFHAVCNYIYIKDKVKKLSTIVLIPYVPFVSLTNIDELEADNIYPVS